MSFTTVPGVTPAKMVVKMPLRRGKNQTPKAKKETNGNCTGEGKWGHMPERSPNILVRRGSRH